MHEKKTIPWINALFLRQSREFLQGTCAFYILHTIATQSFEFSFENKWTFTGEKREELPFTTCISPFEIKQFKSSLNFSKYFGTNQLSMKTSFDFPIDPTKCSWVILIKRHQKQSFQVRLIINHFENNLQTVSKTLHTVFWSSFNLVSIASLACFRLSFNLLT